MKYIYSILFFSAGFISFGQNVQKEEKKHAQIIENPEKYEQEGGVLTDEILGNKIPDKAKRHELNSKDFTIHYNLQFNENKDLEAIRSKGGDYDSAKKSWIDKNQETYEGAQRITSEGYLSPEERMSKNNK